MRMLRDRPATPYEWRASNLIIEALIHLLHARRWDYSLDMVNPEGAFGIAGGRYVTLSKDYPRGEWARVQDDHPLPPYSLPIADHWHIMDTCRRTLYVNERYANTVVPLIDTSLVDLFDLWPPTEADKAR